MEPSDLPFPLVSVAGSARDRGRQYGAEAATRIRRSIEFYAGAVVPASGLEWQEVTDRLLTFASDWRRDEPDLLEEMEGIAEGAEVRFADILGLNCRGSFTLTPTGLDEEGCTSFVVLPDASRDGHLHTGQNWDYLASIRDTVVLVHLRPDHGPQQLLIVEAGQVGRHGVNGAGLALHANGLSGRLRDPAGVPSPIWRRRILREANLSDALDQALRTPRPGTTNLLISHRDGFAVDLETWPHTAREIHPQGGWMVHTNHFLAEIPPPLAGDYAPSGDSIVRLGRARSILESAVRKGGIGSDELRGMLTDHVADGRGICAHAPADAPAHEAWETVASVVTDLTTGTLTIAAGPPCSGTWATIELADLFGGWQPASAAGSAGL